MSKVITHKARIHNQNVYKKYSAIRKQYTEKVYSRSYLTNSKNSASKFKCPRCKFTHTSWHGMKTHLKTVHKVSPHTCHICGYTGSFLSRLWQHVIRNHMDVTPFQCLHCDYSSVTSYAVSLHANKMHDVIQPYKCSKCDFKTSVMVCLTSHFEQYHSAESQFECSECGFLAPELAKMRHHIVNAHNKATSYRCYQCPVVFSAVAPLRSHIKEKHGQDMLYKCNKCSSFATSNMKKFKAHTSSKHRITNISLCLTTSKAKAPRAKNTIHKTAEVQKISKNPIKDASKILLNETTNATSNGSSSLNFDCILCEASFSTSVELCKHMLSNHQKSTGESTGKNVLKVHKCSQCNFAAPDRPKLLSHIRSQHLNFRQMFCQFCNHCCSKIPNMRNHLSSFHKCNTMFECNLCPFVTNLKRFLDRHVLKYHAGK